MTEARRVQIASTTLTPENRTPERGREREMRETRGVLLLNRREKNRQDVVRSY